MRIIVAGGRTFNDYPLLKKTLDEYIFGGNDPDDLVFDLVEIVSGTANGADKLGEKYAIENIFNIKRFPADWDKYQKRAGYIRNEEMAKYANACVCFWDGESKGTKHMIDLAKNYGLDLKVVIYEK